MQSQSRILLPEEPALVIGPAGALWLDPTGEIEECGVTAAAARIDRGARPILCHAPTAAQALGREEGRLDCHDVLELFAFAMPQRFCIPTPGGLAAALGLGPGQENDSGTGPGTGSENGFGTGREPDALDPAGEALALIDAATRLLEEIAGLAKDPGAVGAAGTMAWGGWSWGPAVLAALGIDDGDANGDEGNGGAVAARPGVAGLQFWQDLPEWTHTGSPAPSRNSRSVEPEEARRRLAEALGAGAEERPSQSDYAAAVTPAFATEDDDAPHVVLAEAGTGTGKTIAYLAPASLWAQRNRRPVWLSTYSRNLQDQLDQEAAQIYPDPQERRRRVAIRKGRQNYLCLLNYEDAANLAATHRKDAVGLGLMARWGANTRSGDLTGGDFPAWLVDLFGHRLTLGLADRHGECIHSACPHYRTCYIERNVRAAVRTDLVIANHALVMSHAARSAQGDPEVPPRIVFDEGHHVFDAADSAFSTALNGWELRFFRRWIRGHESNRRRLARGLRVRLEPLFPVCEKAEVLLRNVAAQAGFLPGDGWHERCAGGAPHGSAERFLAAVRDMVYARQSENDAGIYAIECTIENPTAVLLGAADELAEDLELLRRAIETLHKAFADCLEALESREDEGEGEEESGSFDEFVREADDSEIAAIRAKLLAACRSLRLNGTERIVGWLSMLAAVADTGEEDFVDWLSVERRNGGDVDFGLHRHWLDPSVPFARFVAGPADGVLVTSATLRDGGRETDETWRAVEERIGTVHLSAEPARVALPSPFDYDAQTRIIVVDDVNKDDPEDRALAYRVLFEASGGGALGLFTSIQRLRETHRLIAGPLARAGLKVRAQHVDALNLATLTDIFRAERDSCLLGVNALRDGVDVPGSSLRLIVFERVPWPRPSILHKARRRKFGDRSYDRALVRLHLRQAFGRLIRRADDRGVFVLLDPRLRGSLDRAFGEEREILRCGLEAAAAEVSAFLGRPTAGPGSADLGETDAIRRTG